MGIRELKAVYGQNRKPRNAINAAIRQEMPGGWALLDALESADYLAREPLLPIQSQIAQKVLDLLRASRDDMADEIARRYELKSAAGE